MRSWAWEEHHYTIDIGLLDDHRSIAPERESTIVQNLDQDDGECKGRPKVLSKKINTRGQHQTHVRVLLIDLVERDEF